MSISLVFFEINCKFMLETYIDRVYRDIRLERRRWVSGEPWWMPWVIGGVAAAMLGFMKAACG